MYILSTYYKNKKSIMYFFYHGLLSPHSYQSKPTVEWKRKYVLNLKDKLNKIKKKKKKEKGKIINVIVRNSRWFHSTTILNNQTKITSCIKAVAMKSTIITKHQEPITNHHHVMPQERISLTLSRHFSLSFIASGRSSELHPVSSHSCWMYVRAGCPAFARPYVGIHRSTSLMSSSLLLQQWPACLVCLTWIVFVMGGRWPYSWCLVGCCFQDLFNIARDILV